MRLNKFLSNSGVASRRKCDEIILDGKPREVFSHIDTLKKVGLDVPESTFLARELKNQGIDIKGNILTVDELFNEISRIKKV